MIPQKVKKVYKAGGFSKGIEFDFNKDLDVTLRILDGPHCVNSTNSFRNYYPYVDLIFDNSASYSFFIA